MAQDFNPIQGKITLHGLGFIQVKLHNNMRLHVWHPDLPKRNCFPYSPIHNHRFSFRSTVLVGTQINRRYWVKDDEAGTHDLISHDGPRTKTGSRLSYVSGRATPIASPDEIMPAGHSYEMGLLQYHETPNEGIVVTMMEKVEEGKIHAHSLIETGRIFDQEFDRYQLSEDQLWAYVREAMS